MRPRTPTHARAMTLVEVLVVFAIVALLVALVAPRFGISRQRAVRACCNCHLKQIGLAFRIYANDHDGDLPWNTSVTNGGTTESRESSQVFRHFLAASNELSTPKILTCPVDTQKFVTSDFSIFGNSNLSYFVAVSSDETDPQAPLSGDRNISGGSLSNGFMQTFLSPLAAQWTRALHDRNGNYGLADGSVQQLTSWGVTNALAIALRSNSIIRIALP